MTPFQIEKAIEQDIITNRFPAGSRLPAERNLASQYSVNRVTVRAAIACLVSRGLVENKQGSGNIVKNAFEHAGPKVLHSLLRDADNQQKISIAKDVLHVRRNLARTIMENLPSSADWSSDVLLAIAELQRLATMGGTVEEIAAADIAVLRKLICETKSLALSLFINPLFNCLEYFPELVQSLYRAPKQNVFAYQNLLLWGQSETREVGVVISLMEATDADTLLDLKERLAA